MGRRGIEPPMLFRATGLQPAEHTTCSTYPWSRLSGHVTEHPPSLHHSGRCRLLIFDVELLAQVAKIQAPPPQRFEAQGRRPERLPLFSAPNVGVNE